MDGQADRDEQRQKERERWMTDGLKIDRQLEKDGWMDTGQTSR